MSELIIYGTYASRASRNVWMALELGIDFRFESVDVHKNEHLQGGFGAINPNVRVPAIKDGDFVMWESLAINLYLAKKHGGPLAPKTLEDLSHRYDISRERVRQIEAQAFLKIQKSMKNAIISRNIGC